MPPSTFARDGHGGFIPTAQWWGVAIKNVPSASAWATAASHSALSSFVRVASENRSPKRMKPGVSDFDWLLEQKFLAAAAAAIYRD
jgi:hypothetical protein